MFPEDDEAFPELDGWHYATIVRYYHLKGSKYKEKSLTIGEIYPGPQGNVVFWTEGENPFGSNMEELTESFKMMLDDYQKYVYDACDLPGYEKKCDKTEVTREEYYKIDAEEV